ncbi:13443_t:CDS:2 [Funneliformis geosporum]|nr:13443_t:CDS:2 [Funneliformis geosporum]
MTVILKTKDRDFSVDSESNTESIFETGNKFGFSQNDMAKWDQPVEVSIGVNTSFFIAREAVIYGLRCDNVYLYPELAADTKGYICIRNSAKQGPPQFKEDIFSGTITENNNDIRTCSEPVARKDPERN